MRMTEEKLAAFAHIIENHFDLDNFDEVIAFANDRTGVYYNSEVWLCPELITRLMEQAYDQGARDGEDE